MYVTISRVAGDVYINGEKKIFAVDFRPSNPTTQHEFANVEWLLGWAKIGLMSKGHTVPHFETRDLSAFGNTQPMMGEKP